MTTPKPDDGRTPRVLARPLIQAGVERAAGETVRLRPDQVERLEPDGYFEPPTGAAKGGKK